MQKGTPNWAELRALGVAWWVNNQSTLRTCVEKVRALGFVVTMVSARHIQTIARPDTQTQSTNCLQLAKVAFQQRNDPMDAAIYYLAMKKKNVLTHLFK